MSQIAAALAKAKERPHMQATSTASVGSSPLTQPTRRISPNLIWSGVLILSVLGAGAVYWMNRTVTAEIEATTATEAPAGMPAVYYSNKTSAGSGAPVAPAVSTAKLTPAAALAKLNRNEIAVRQLNISAMLPGDSPRLMTNGKVYHVGDIVIPPEIAFGGTSDGLLVFIDGSGNRFTRRF